MLNRKDKYISLIITVLFHVVLILVLLLMGFSPTPPPFPEPDGMMISFGETPTGEGEVMQPTQQMTESASAESTPTENMTQEDEDAPALQEEKSKPKEKKQIQPKTDAKEIPTEPKDKINTNALFPSDYKSNSKNASSSGQTGGTGMQGNENGSPTSTNAMGQGKGSSGISYSLGDRSARGTLPQPQYPPGNIKGKVVVNIKVDRNGNVISATAPGKGSTTVNSALVRAAIKAAYKAKFSKDLGSIEQIGTITYHFKLH